MKFQHSKHKIYNKKQITHFNNVMFSVEKFQDFVLNERNIETLLRDRKRMEDSNQNFNKQVELEKKNNLSLQINSNINNFNEDFLNTKHKDSLFWCFYIMENGISNYEMVHGDGFKEAMQYKIFLVEKLRKYKDILKKYKFKKNKIEADLVNSNFINISTFMCICAIHDYNIIVIDNYKFYKLFRNDEIDKNLCIIKKNKDKFCLCIGDKKTKIDIYNSCVTNKWEITNISKPLNAISAYKLKDLQNICKKLKINIFNDKKTFIKKSILYASIQKQL